ncbi:hypothetical protein F3K02_09070 [Hydrogenophaga sp. D2P1]|uniref:Uncharacterized protein n=1 Tax=Hydrogenophaga aromaticivorans TaxID=2610898 RepID=A0A7Y8GV28_9BURK|nr:hypothetical protein [Hydrogenophaga aromaticivorans]NWF45396.1 hypothetical protein [Hydrogenophaga aromaticivorans]
MGKKMTAYARKRLGNPTARTFNGAEFLNTLQRCRPYTDEPLPGSWLEGTQDAADNARNIVNRALGALVSHKLKPEESAEFDLLAHAIGVALIRSIEIGGDDCQPVADCRAGSEALRSIQTRRNTLGKWATTRPEQLALGDAILVYEAILQASSPQQMVLATQARMRILEAMRSTTH